jgi:hypothetical protein
MATVAAAGLALVLFALSFAPQPGQPLPVAKRPAVDIREAGPAIAEKPAGDGAKSPGNSPPGHATYHVSSEEELRKALNRGDAVILDQDITLAGPGPALQRKQGGNLRVEPAPERGTATVRLKYVPELGEADPLWAGLVIESGKVTFRSLRFEIEGAQPPENVLLAGVVLKAAADVTFERCTFVQTNVAIQPFIGQKSNLVPIASVAVHNPRGGGTGQPRVIFSECYFQEGQDAVLVDGPADVQPMNCAFGKHCALFHLRAEGDSAPARIQLQRCSAFVVNGPAFRLDGSARCRLSISKSIFSCPDDTGTVRPHDETHLIRQTKATTPAVQYEGDANCFHNLNALWALPNGNGKGDRIITEWPAFLAEVERAKGRGDTLSTVLDARQNPWREDEPLLAKNPREAFQVNPNLPELRDHNSDRPLGLLECVWGREYGTGYPPLPSPRPAERVAIGPKTRVVDPNGAGGTERVYSTLTGALEDAQPGDEILIKTRKNNRWVEVSPVRLKPNLGVTLKPFPDHHPILTLAATTDEEDAALFRLNHGKLALENLEFHLKPDKKGYKFQSVVAMKGNGLCVFKHCVVTLAGEDPGVRLSVVTLLDPRDTMVMPGVKDPRPAPDIKLENCLVRGDGDGLAVRASRPFDFAIENGIAALAGSLVRVKGGGADLPGGAAGKIKLDRVTTYLGDHLVHLAAGPGGKGLAPTSVSAANCLFAAAGGKSFIHLDGPDSEKQMKELFSWDGRHNAYDGFDKLLDQQPAGEAMVMLRYDQDKWRMFANESDPQPLFMRARCFDLATDRPLAQAVPEDFKVKPEFRTQLQNYGASLARDALPRLTQPETPAPEPAGSEP